MKGDGSGPAKVDDARPDDARAAAGDTPLLELRVFGGFDALLDGEPIDSSSTRQRRVQTLLGILAVNHGKDLYSDHIADSIWPRSPDSKKRHCFYNLWYLATHAVYPGKHADNPYFERRQYTCRLLDDHVRTDVAVAERALRDLVRIGNGPVEALDAYRRLQGVYRGELLPGEVENGIVMRARREWHDRVLDALSGCAHQMAERGEDRTALWLATAACRLGDLREDVVRLRIELYAKLGMRAHAVRAFAELEAFLREEVGVSPSPQSFQVLRQVIDPADWSLAFPPAPLPRRRGSGEEGDRPAQGGARRDPSGESPLLPGLLPLHV